MWKLSFIRRLSESLICTTLSFANCNIDKWLFCSCVFILNPSIANPAKWSNTLKQQSTNFLSVFDHFWGLVHKGLTLKRFFPHDVYKTGAWTVEKYFWYNYDIKLHFFSKSSITRQKVASQNGCFKKTKHAEFSEKRTFLTP